MTLENDIYLPDDLYDDNRNDSFSNTTFLKTDVVTEVSYQIFTVDSSSFYSDRTNRTTVVDNDDCYDYVCDSLTTDEPCN